MPRKKNGMPFEAYPGPNKDDDGQKLLFARSARGRHLLKALQKSINANNGYTTVANFAYYSDLTAYSARKRLNKWYYGEHPRLKTMSYGRTTVYIEV